jgi:cytochrome c2
MVGLALVSVCAKVAAAQDVKSGKDVFNQCMICHAIGPGAQNRIGPELDGRHPGSVANFDYSDANKNSGIVWNEASFKQLHCQSTGDDSGHQNAFCWPQRFVTNQRPLGLYQAV